MIQVHTGRGWRFNPHLLAELRAGVDRGVAHPPIMDVLGVEVDGVVDLFTGLSEDLVVEVTADLVTAVSRLLKGYRRSQVTCSGGTVELLLEARGELALLSMVRVRRPSAVLLRDLELDLPALASATRRSAEGLLTDLRRIHPGLANQSPVQRLIRSLRASKGGRSGAKAPPAPTRVGSRPLVSQRHHPGEAGFRVEVLDEDGLLSSFEGGRADLHSLLALGRLALDPGGDLPSWSLKGVPFLMLKDLVQSALEMVRAIEHGDPEHELTLGSGVALHFRLGGGPAPTASFVRDTSRGRQRGTQGQVPCDPAPFLSTVFEAALGFGALAQRQNARHHQNQPLVVLLSDAHEGMARCRELSPPKVVPEPLQPAAPGRSNREAKLAPGRIKLLSYCKAWEHRLPGSARRIVCRPGLVLAMSEGAAVALSPRGELRWSIAGEGILAAAVPGAGVVAAVDRRLCLVGNDGQVVWNAARLDGPARSLALVNAGSPEGVRAFAAAASDTEVVCVDVARGKALWRFAPPGATRTAVHSIRGRLLVSTGDGRLYGISPARGKLLWRARGKLLEGLPCFRDWVLQSDGHALLGVSLMTGQRRSFGDPELSRVGGGMVTRASVLVAGLSGTQGAVVAFSPEGRLLWRWSDDERVGPGIPLLVPLPVGLVVRTGRSLTRLDPEGRVCWSHPLSEEVHDGLVPVRRRGVVLGAGDAGLFAFDEESGAVLGQVDDQQAVAAMAVDSKLDVYVATEDGPLRALHVQRFLSVV